jgi:hypothetical protein
MSVKGFKEYWKNISRKRIRNGKRLKPYAKLKKDHQVSSWYIRGRNGKKHRSKERDRMREKSDKTAARQELQRKMIEDSEVDFLESDSKG